MLSGAKNLVYIARGPRAYGTKPVLPRRRGCWEFEFVLKGRARPYPVPFASEEDYSPRLYVFPPYSAHGWTDDEGAFSDIFVTHFREVPEEVAARLDPAVGLRLPLDESAHRRLVPRLGEVWTAAQGRGGARASLRLQQFLLELSALVLDRIDHGGETAGPDDKVTKAFHWLEENLGENPTIAQAARVAGVSAAHLRRLCARSGRRPPHKELARLRLEAAQRCLLQGWKQAAIADYLGFSETSAFARAFRAGCGLAPGEWLAKARKARR
jgi:AraC-type DNA-binding domain-containing proteins